MVETYAIIRNAMGIHCRPSAIIVRECRGFRGEAELHAEGRSCDPRSMVGLISMGLAEGTTVRIRVSGRGEKAFAEKLVELMERKFDFPPDPGSASPLRNAAPIGAA